jgi:hypothetical protein
LIPRPLAAGELIFLKKKERIMVDLGIFEPFKRTMRLDGWDEIGVSTWTKIKEAIQEGRYKEACELVDYLNNEGKFIHDLLCDWPYVLLDYIVKRVKDEEEVYHALRYCNKVLSNSLGDVLMTATPKELVQRQSELLRAHRTGAGEMGTHKVIEEEDRYVMILDPCGSGGRMMRTGELDNLPPRTGAPYNLGVTKKPYPWTWNLAGVPYYCAHCCVWMEILPIESRGYPVRIHEWPRKPEDPCINYFYKSPELIPEIYFNRVGKKKDPSKFKANL